MLLKCIYQKKVYIAEFPLLKANLQQNMAFNDADRPKCQTHESLRFGLRFCKEITYTGMCMAVIQNQYDADSV